MIKESIALVPALGARGVLVGLFPLPLTLALRSVRPEPDTDDVRRDTLADLGPSTLLAPLAGIALALLTCILLQVLVGGTKPDYAAAWRQVRSRLAAVVGLSLTLSLVNDFATIFLKYLGTLLVSLPLALAYPILLHEQVGVLTALRRSAHRMQGNYSALFGAWFVLGGAIILVMAAALFGIDIALGRRVFSVARAGLEGANELLMLPVTIATVLYYVKLPPRVLPPVSTAVAGT